MPTYNHICNNKECNNEWEDFYSISKDPPKICPKCNQETAERVISGGNGRGIMELTGYELKEKVAQDVNSLKRELRTNENLYANILGESKYHQIQSQMDSARKDRGRK